MKPPPSLTSCFSLALSMIAVLTLFSPSAFADPFSYETTAAGSFDDKGGAAQNPLVRTIDVTDDFTINDLNVGFNANHTWRGDVRVTLVSPAGTSVQIVALPTGDSDDHFDVLLDSASANPLDDNTNNLTLLPYYERTAAPSSSLNPFNGQSALGTWTLRITDLQVGAPDERVGTFNRARLDFEGTLASATAFAYETTASGNFDDKGGAAQNPLIRTITVSDSFAITDLNVGLNVDHTWRGDVRVTLISPAGTSVQIAALPTGDSNDHFDVILDDASSNPLDDNTDNTTGSPYYERIATPSNALSAFNGESAQGVWTLRLTDLQVGASSERVGTFNRARLEFTGAPILSPGSIGGVVWNDSDGNGSQNGGEAGFFNVTLDLISDLNGNGADDSEPVVASQSTTASGAYDFTNLTPGDYIVRVTDTGSVLNGLSLTGGSNPTAVSGLAAGQDFNDGHFGYQSTLTASIGGTIWADTNGNGSQDGGEAGLQNVTVGLIVDGNGNGVIDGAESASVAQTTNINGLFDFTNLAAGNYLVDVTDTNNIVGSLALTTGTDPVVISGLAAGQDFNGANLGYWSVATTMGDLVWDDVNGDGVKNSGENGIPGVTVQLLKSGTPVSSTTTNALGGYSFNGFSTGAYTIRLVESGVLSGATRTYDEDSGTASPDGVTVVALGSGGIHTSADFGYQLPAGAPSLKSLVAQTFFVPLPEEHVRTALDELDAHNGRVGNEIESVISIVSTASGTIICYDHWEDGYETDIANPTQLSTQIWGDNQPINGIPPGFATDTIDANDVVALENPVLLPRNATVLAYDGRDKIITSRAVAVTRAAWGSDPGQVLAGAVEVCPVAEYGTQYESPVGEDLSSNQVFEYVALHIVASRDATSVAIDTDGDGTDDITTFLNEGEAYQVNGGIQTGATVVASKPVEAHLITGDRRPSGYFETRWYTLYPTEDWSANYYSPVGSSAKSDTIIFVYNPNPGSLNVGYSTSAGSGSFSVGSGSAYPFTMPVGAGAHFYSTNGNPFFAIAAVAAGGDVDNDIYDWGFSLVPGGNLTSEVVVGWGPGVGNPGNGTAIPNLNGNPVWVTAGEDTTLYVDYDSDPSTGPNTDAQGRKYDVIIALDALQSVKVYDNADKDQTGMRLYTLDGTNITAAWGQDPDTANPGNPFLDMGTTILPFPVASVTKQSALATDANSNGLANWGDTLQYTITVVNRGSVSVTNITMVDDLPAELTYVPNSTRLNGAPIPDDSAGTPIPVDGAGYVLLDLAPGESASITYQGIINVNAETVINDVNVFSGAGILVDVDIIEVPPGDASTASTLAFTDSGGTPVSLYMESDTIHVRVTDADQNTNTGTTQSLSVVLTNASGDDLESLTLTETGSNTGIFTGSIPSSGSTGLQHQDGTLYAVAGHTLVGDYVDPLFGDAASDSVDFGADTEVKTLYLSDPGQRLHRIDPVATGDTSTASTVELSTGGGPSGTEFLTAVKDTYVKLKSSFASLNYGGSNSLIVDRESNDLHRALVEFDLSGIPAGATITSATLNLNCTDIGGALSVAAYGVPSTDPWTEGTGDGSSAVANWNERISGTSWTNTGVIGDPASVTALDTLSNINTTGTHSFSVTSLVQDWVDGSKTNNGFAIASPDGGGDRTVTYDSRESGGSPPQLVVVYGGEATFNLISDRDSMLQETSPIVDHSITEKLRVEDVDPAKDIYGAFRFDLATITPGATVSSAIAHFFVADVKANSSVNVHRITAPWTESGINWSTASTAFDPVPDAVLVATTPDDDASYVSVDVTSLVQEWLDGTANHGFMLIPNGAELKDIGSREKAGEEPLLDVVISTGSGGSAGNYRDEFGGTRVYNSSHGTADWSGNSWVEIAEPTGSGPSDGPVQVSPNTTYCASPNCLRVGGTQPGNPDPGFGVSRELDLSGASSATLSYTYQRGTFGSPTPTAGTLTVDMSGDGGGSWTTIQSYNFDSIDGSQTNESFDISAYIAANTQIRFLTHGPVDDIVFFIDNIDISFGGGDGGSSATFTQSPTMARDFVMPGGGIVTATAHVNVTSGSLPANPDVTAVLKRDSTTILTLTNPTLAANTLTWTGALSGQVTVASGERVVLDITTNETATFEILYDSNTAPSRLDLPAGTIINVDALEFYDAAYPSGNVITSAGAGQTVYVRSTVSDPFGAYDITDLDLLIPPVVLTTLTDANVVASTAATKTYEYAWQTGSTEGRYSISATANEGTEGIFHTAVSDFVVTSQDTGTKSFASFTDSGGAPVAVITPNSQACVRVIDFDENTNTGVVETIAAVITSSTGDFENVILTETGTDTGIFAICLPSSVSGGGTANDAVVHAPIGATLLVRYVDPNDPADLAEATAVVKSLGASISVATRLAEPSDGTAVAGQFVEFEVVVINNGTTTVTSATVTDTFDASCFSYHGDTTPAPDTVAGNTLTWNNVGPLLPGSSRRLTVYLNATGACNPAVNQVSVSAVDDLANVLAAGPASAQVVITQPQIQVTTTLTSPDPAKVDDFVSFRIAVQNTGTTSVVTAPFSFAFSTCLSLDSASIIPDSAGTGNLLWSNLGPLAVGASQTIDVIFSAESPCNPATATGDVSFAVDINGDAVPRAQGSAQVVIDPAVPIGDSFFVHEDTDTIYRINLSDGSTALLGNTSATSNMNALAYDNTSGAAGTLWYTDNVSYDLYKFDVATGSEIGTMGNLGNPGWTNPVNGGKTDGGAWYDGAYYVGTELTDDIWKVTFNAGFTSVTDVEKVADTKGGTGNDIWGDFVISSSGVLYGVENGNIFSFDLNTGGPQTTLGSSAVINGLQIGGDGLLYGIASTEPNAPLYTINLTTNTIALHRNTSLVPSPGDMAGPVAADPVGLVSIGNLVFDDANDDGNFDSGPESGIDGVAVQLFRKGQAPGVDTPVDETTTSANGTYLFTVASGEYFVHIPPTEFLVGKPLNGYYSSPGFSSDQTLDDDADENGVDLNQPWISGISTIAVTLRLGSMPISSGGLATESGHDNESDDYSDSDANLTIDLGFTTTPPTISALLPDCYLASDEGRRLTSFNTGTNAESDIGSIQIDNFEAIEFDPISDKLYGAAGDELYEIDRDTGAITLMGEFSPNSSPIPNGALGTIDFRDVDGLARDPIKDIWYGSVRVDDGVAGGNPDVLFQFDATTGHYIPGAFSGDDYVAIQKPQANVHLIDDLGFDPLTGKLFGVANGNGVYNSETTVVEIEPLTGATIDLGQIVYDPDGAGPQPTVNVGDVEGLTMTLNGKALVLTGDGGNLSNMLFSLQGVGSGGAITATRLSDIGFGGLYTDYEGCTCAVYNNPAEVGGTVFEDFDADGVRGGVDGGIPGVTVQIRNGLTGDVISSQTTNAIGGYQFTGLPVGPYQVVVADSNFNGGPLEGRTPTSDPEGDNDNQGVFHAPPLPLDSIAETMSFDGDSDWAQTGPGGFSSPAGPFTMTAWVKPDHKNQLGGILGTTTGDGFPKEFLFQEGDQFAVQFASVLDVLKSETRVTPGFWYHVAATYDGATLGLYINGRLESSKQTLLGPSSSNRIWVGMIWGSTGYIEFSGDVDAISYWDTALTESRILQLAHNGAVGDEPGLNAYWDWDNGTGVQGGWDYARGTRNLTLYGDSTRINVNFLTALDFGYSAGSKSDSYATWQSNFSTVLNGFDQPDDNHDGDIYDNLLEYALCLHPGTGVYGPGGFVVEPNGNNLDAVFWRRAGGLNDVTYKLDGLAALPLFDSDTWDVLLTIPGSGAPPAGVTVTDLGYGIEEVRIASIDATPPLSSTDGFARLTVELDDGSLTATSYTPVFGWHETTIEEDQIETFASPFTKVDAISGAIDSLIGTHRVDISTAMGSISLEQALDIPNQDYYLEIIEGDNIGHRFDIVDGAGSILTLATDTSLGQGPPHNTVDTSTAIPANLVADRFILREHYTLAEYFPPGLPFTAQTSNSNPNNPADNTSFFDGSNWSTYWLFDNGANPDKWVLNGDLSFADRGTRVIAPGEGLFLYPRSADVIMLALGVVRKNDFALPLPLGFGLMAPGFPINQSPAERAMSEATFDGDADPSLADNFYSWNGDNATYEAAYRCVFLIENVPGFTSRWTVVDDPLMSPVDHDSTLFKQDRSQFFYRVNSAKTNYTLPLPWCIGLIGE